LGIYELKKLSASGVLGVPELSPGAVRWAPPVRLHTPVIEWHSHTTRRSFPQPSHFSFLSDAYINQSPRYSSI